MVVQVLLNILLGAKTPRITSKCPPSHCCIHLGPISMKFSVMCSDLFSFRRQLNRQRPQCGRSAAQINQRAFYPPRPSAKPLEPAIKSYPNKTQELTHYRHSDTLKDKLVNGRPSIGCLGCELRSVQQC